MEPHHPATGLERGQRWAVRERVFKAIDTLVMAGILEMPTGNAANERFRLKARTPKISPYIFTARARDVREPERNCYLLKDIIFGQLGAIPTYCMKHCWKIVIKVATIADLFALLDVMTAKAWPGKCGFDTRDYTFGNCVGFRYFNSREDGEAAFDQTVEAVRARIPSAQLYLKRSCTEFELKAPSTAWNHEDQFADAVAAYLAEWVEWEAETHEQTEYVVARVKSYWVEKAYNVGDPTLEQIVPDFRSMYPQPVRYKETT